MKERQTKKKKKKKKIRRDDLLLRSDKDASPLLSRFIVGMGALDLGLQAMRARGFSVASNLMRQFLSILKNGGALV